DIRCEGHQDHHDVVARRRLALLRVRGVARRVGDGPRGRVREGVLEGLRLRVIVILSLCVAATTFADEVSLLHGLDTDDAHALSAAVAAIEHAPTTRELADVLFA